MLKARGLWYRSGNGRFSLSPLDLECRGGELLLVTGPNGSGKSTLLSLLSGRRERLRGAWGGELTIQGQHALESGLSSLFGLAASMGPRAEAELFRDSVREELGFALENLGLGERERERRILETAGALDLLSLLERSPRELSGGEQKRVLLASLIAIEPKLLVLDEPLAGLDAVHREAAAQLLRRTASRGALVILCEHERACLEPLADRELVLEGGRVTYLGPVLQTPEVTAAPRREVPDSCRPPTGRVRLQAQDLAFSFRGTHVIDLEQLAVGKGITLLRGENGSGKSTLLALLRGLLPCKKGTILFDGRKRARASRETGLGLVIQESSRQFFRLTVAEELECALRGQRGGAKAKRMRRIGELTELFGLGPLLKERPFELSTGEKRRTAIAGILALEPTFLLLDEAESALDSCYRCRLEKELIRLADCGVDSLASLHGEGFLEKGATGELHLAGGKILQRNTEAIYAGA